MTAKAALFTGCREKTCCRVYTVYPTGMDVWRIATALQVPPWAFVTAVPAERGDPDGFVLDAARASRRLALIRRPGGACTFLLDVGGAARCSLGALRPDGCRSFPSVLGPDGPRVRDDGVCTCRDWAQAALDAGEERAQLEAEAAERERYRRVLARWNTYAGRLPEDDAADLRDLCRYLLDVYQQVGA